jgi:putative membrane protein
MSWYDIFPMVSTAFIAISGILVAIGWRLILKKKRKAHQNVMVAAAIAASLFFIIYVSRTIFIGNTMFNGPENLKILYLIFLLFHIVLAIVAAAFGITTLTLAYRKNFAKHRKWGRVTASIWFVTVITGITVYVLLYLCYPGGHTKPVINAIFGI